jgi:trehalose synthase
VREVQVGAVPIDRLTSLLEPSRAARLVEIAARARRLLAGRTIWNVNATATGGGVAEMLQALLDYAHGVGVDTRWLVLDGTPGFFAVTKRIHNLLHGEPGDGGGLGEDDRRVYEDALRGNAEHLIGRVRPGDIVLLHDPQTAGLLPALRDHGAHVIWRCHVGRDTPNDRTDLGWDFLRPYLADAAAAIFSRSVYRPDYVDPERSWVIAPSLDPFSAKNAPLTDDDVAAALQRARLVDLPTPDGELGFHRRDGSRGVVRRHQGLVVTGGIVPEEARVVLQVSRWDRLKDMPGVMHGFVRRLDRLDDDIHLMLAGPEVSGVADDPEGAEVLAECRSAWADLDPPARERVHLCSLPMDDVDENAHLVNALQRHATVVVQKSLVEGFGLTVTEPMWKGRPVVATRVGGIQDQVVHGESGLLLDDPTDLDGFGDLLESVTDDPALGARLGKAARERVREHFLGDRHLIQYAELFRQLLAGARD